MKATSWVEPTVTSDELRASVGEILRDSGRASVPEPLRDVVSFQAAARYLVEAANCPVVERLEMLTSLSALARNTAELSDMAAQAVWFEAAEFVTGHPASSRPDRGWLAKQRRMRSSNYERCPACGCQVLDQAGLERYSRLEQDALRDAALRESRAALQESRA